MMDWTTVVQPDTRYTLDDKLRIHNKLPIVSESTTNYHSTVDINGHVPFMLLLSHVYPLISDDYPTDIPVLSKY